MLARLVVRRFALTQRSNLMRPEPINFGPGRAPTRKFKQYPRWSPKKGSRTTLVGGGAPKQSVPEVKYSRDWSPDKPIYPKKEWGILGTIVRILAFVSSFCFLNLFPHFLLEKISSYFFPENIYFHKK